MNTGTQNTVGPTRLVAQAIFTLVVGIFVSICTLIVQALVVLFGRRAKEIEEPAVSNSSPAGSCSICQRSMGERGVEAVHSP